MHESPENVPLVTYLWVIALSIWGGVASHIRKIREGTIPRFSISEFVGDVVISGLVGVLTFFLCDAYNVNGMLSAFLVGVSAHMGTRAIYAMENMVSDRIKIKMEENHAE